MPIMLSITRSIAAPVALPLRSWRPYWSIGQTLSVVAAGYLLIAFPAVLLAQPVADPPPDSSPAANSPSPAQEPAPTTAQFESWIAQLGDNDYFVRQRAQQSLAEAGFAAFDALLAAEHSPDLEIAARVTHLLKLLSVHWTIPDDPAPVRALLRDYENLSRAERLEVIQQLGRLSDDAGLAPLCRMVHFERAPLHAKFAALAVLDLFASRPMSTAPSDASANTSPASPSSSPISLSSNDPALLARRQQTVASQLKSSTSPGTEWIRCALDEYSDPAAAAQRWTELIDAEAARLANYPDQSSAELLRRLARRQADLWLRLDNRPAALVALTRMLDFDEGDTASLTDLLDVLVAREAWPVVDELARRFQQRLQREPLLCYLLANARRQQGDQQATEQLVARAAQLQPADQQLRIRMALYLQRRGLFDWSEIEFRAAIKLCPKNDATAFELRRVLAEMFHDLRRDADAATALDEALADLAPGNAPAPQVPLNRDPATVRARACYFRACAAHERGDLQEELNQLDAGLQHDPTDAEILIALYHMPNLDDQRRQRTLKLLNAAIELFRQEIAENPDNEFYYNQFAWLVANTEGDFQEALRCSQKSLELRPGEPGYLDTLARCYYALGELNQAIKYQSEAVRLEPHTMQIRRQLEQFQAEFAQRAAPSAAPKSEQRDPNQP